jgi:hypothetical protein
VDDRVGIENENVVPGALDNACVISLRETEIAAILENANAWVILVDKLYGAVTRPIVRDDHFELDVMRFRVDRTQTVANDLQVIPTKNYDR